jgi:mannan endo-1,4-beta-mannosidase
VAGYRPRVPAVIWYGCTAVVALAVVASAFVFSRTAAPARSPVAALKPVQTGFHLGVFEPSETVSYQQVTQFAAAVGREPDLVLYYSGWGEPFLTQFAQTAYAHGAEPVVQIYPPAHGDLAQIAAGRDDRFLRSYAAQVRAFRHRVILSFAPEPNGPWYPWGWTRTPAATWVAAWRHVVTVFRATGATNVTWLMTLNVSFRGSGPVAAYWPGAAYVDWIGVDGYYERPWQTFRNHFLPTVRAVRKLTSKPLLVSEASVGPLAGQLRGIADLFTAIRHYGLTGLVWFDERQSRGIHHQDWRLGDNPAAVTLFRQEARNFGRPLP